MSIAMGKREPKHQLIPKQEWESEQEHDVNNVHYKELEDRQRDLKRHSNLKY